jgi:hypothetical protein
MVQPFYNEQAVTIDGETLRLVINFRTLDAIEAQTGKDFDSILRQLTAGRKRVPLSLQAKLVWGLLREHHPEVTLDEAMTLTMGEAGETIGLAIGQLIDAAFPVASAKEAKGGNPPEPPGA